MSSHCAIATRRFVARKTEQGTLLAETQVGDIVHQSFLWPDLTNTQNMPRAISGVQKAIPVEEAISPKAPETHFFEGRHVVLAVRTTEQPDALLPWLRWHADLGYDAALLVDCPGGLDERFLAALPEVEGLKALVAVSATVPLHAAKPRPKLTEPMMIEAVRHRFLATANSVTCLTLSDLMLMPIRDLTGKLASKGLVTLGGRSAFPLRLRKGKPAPFHDHIYVSSGVGEDRRAWSVAPLQCRDDVLWMPARRQNTTPDAHVSEAFVHATGVAHSGVDPKQLVDKSALSEQPGLAARMERVFVAKPIRRPSSPAKAGRGDDVAIVTVMKNEGPFILDWIAYHRAIGIDRFVVFTNDCEDGTDRLLSALAAHGILEHHVNPYKETGKVPQRAALDAAQELSSVKASGWLMTLDVDEYLNIHAGEGRIADLRRACPDANAFSIPWRLFGSADREAFCDEPVTHQFEACAPAFCSRPHQAWGFKTLYQNAGYFRRLGVHRPLGLAPERLASLRWVNGSGEALPQRHWRKAWRMTAETWGYDLATINHYAVRSAESYLVKRHRGRVNHTGRDQSDGYWFRMNQNADRDVSIRRMDGPAAVERVVLAALPGVADLHAASVTWHIQKIAELKADPDYRALYDKITGPRLRRLSRMPGRFGSNVYLAGPDSVPDEVLNRSLDADWVYTITRANRKD